MKLALLALCALPLCAQPAADVHSYCDYDPVEAAKRTDLDEMAKDAGRHLDEVCFPKPFTAVHLIKRGNIEYLVRYDVGVAHKFYRPVGCHEQTFRKATVTVYRLDGNYLTIIGVPLQGESYESDSFETVRPYQEPERDLDLALQYKAFVYVEPAPIQSEYVNYCG